MASPSPTPGAAAVVPMALPVTSALVIEAGGGVGLDRERLSAVAPTASFEVRIGIRATEARLVLEDAQGALVPATGSTEVGADTAFELKPSEPLKPGSTFLLRLEGQRGRIVRDPEGHSYEPLVFRVRVNGSPEPAPPRRKRVRGHTK